MRRAGRDAEQGRPASRGGKTLFAPKGPPASIAGARRVSSKFRAHKSVSPAGRGAAGRGAPRKYKQIVFQQATKATRDLLFFARTLPPPAQVWKPPRLGLCGGQLPGRPFHPPARGGRSRDPPLDSDRAQDPVHFSRQDRLASEQISWGQDRTKSKYFAFRGRQRPETDRQTDR